MQLKIEFTLNPFQCIHAMDERCLAWRVKDDGKDDLPFYQSEFIGGQKFYLPFRCEDKRIIGSELCSTCYRKKEVDRTKSETERKRFHPSRYWGLITDPQDSILSVSQFPFTESWKHKAKEKGISEKSMAKAKKAMDKAKGVQVEEKTVEEVKEVKEKKKPRIKVPQPRTKKEIETVPKALALLQQSESDSVEEVITVKVQRFEFNGKKYYLNITKYKVYDYQADGGSKGIYQGRWDPATETLHTELADSDNEA